MASPVASRPSRVASAAAPERRATVTAALAAIPPPTTARARAGIASTANTKSSTAMPMQRTLAMGNRRDETST
jgi:hypothetical protein